MAAQDNKDVRNSQDKASRFRVNQSDEGKTAVRAFREPKPQGGGGGLFGLFGGGGSKQSSSSSQQKSKPGDFSYGSATGKPNEAENIRNSKDKASRWRVDQSEEGKTAIRRFNNPTASRGPSNPSSNTWQVPSKFSSIQARADKYMKGAISARDMAATVREKNFGAAPEELIGSCPEGPKRSALFKMFTQL